MDWVDSGTDSCSQQGGPTRAEVSSSEFRSSSPVFGSSDPLQEDMRWVLLSGAIGISAESYLL